MNTPPAKCMFGVEFKLPLVSNLLLAYTQHVHKQPYCSLVAHRQLPEKRERRIYIVSLTGFCIKCAS